MGRRRTGAYACRSRRVRLRAVAPRHLAYGNPRLSREAVGAGFEFPPKRYLSVTCSPFRAGRPLFDPLAGLPDRGRQDRVVDDCCATRYNPSNPMPESHIGAHLRRHALPAGMSVSEAASRLGVSRSALSNLLNGRSALSPKMAGLLERAFGCDGKNLLDAQARLQSGRGVDDGRRTPVRPVAPPSLREIRATEINDWADRDISARHRLAGLVRRLIYSTSNWLTRLDFPAHESAERPGPDGELEAVAATPWIPAGRSLWELGTSKDALAKANSDYRKRTQQTPEVVRSDSTFVFVTSRLWPKKAAWEVTTNKEGRWKEVRALDAGDLQQWIETSPSAQIWLSKEWNQPISGFRTLDEVWTEWAEATDPKMTPAMFKSAVHVGRAKFDRWWATDPRREPFIIEADSTREALAFLHCLLTADELVGRHNRAIVIDSPETLGRLTVTDSNTILISASAPVRAALSSLWRRFPVIVVQPRQSGLQDADISVDIPGHFEFQEALSDMGLTAAQILPLSLRSGRSPTVLRRALSPLGAVPEWVQDTNLLSAFSAMALVGRWHTEKAADRKAISTVADMSDEQMDIAFRRLERLDDTPVWAVGSRRGVVSSLDMLFCLKGRITDRQVDRFFSVAETVLSEPDPALELAEEQRWAATLHDKSRRHSDGLRKRVADTLAILAAHDQAILGTTAGPRVSQRIFDLVHGLLNPLSEDKLRSQKDALPLYAEAAPEAVLSALEADLDSEAPAALRILAPTDGTHMHTPDRIGLLWAIECLAWRAEDLRRVVRILTQLASTDLTDSWIPKPFDSLAQIFSPVAPQTTATITERITELRTLITDEPQLGWTICHGQLNHGPKQVDQGRRPRWSGDGRHRGVPVPQTEFEQANDAMLTVLLECAPLDDGRVVDLFDLLRFRSSDDRRRIWNRIAIWAEKEADDAARASVKNRLRWLVPRDFRREMDEERENDGKTGVEVLLTPTSVVERNTWLFSGSQDIEDWESERKSDTVEGWDAWRKSVRDRQRHAVRDVWDELGVGGILAFVDGAKEQLQIGRVVAEVLEDAKEPEVRRHLVRSALMSGTAEDREHFLAGLMWDWNPTDCRTAVEWFSESAEVRNRLRVLSCLPVRSSTWRIVEGEPTPTQEQYWRRLRTGLWIEDDGERAILLNHLLRVGRVQEAVRLAGLALERLETAQLRRLLFAIPQGEEPGFRISRDRVERMMEELRRRTGVSVEELLELELVFSDGLMGKETCLPTLEREMWRQPDLFVLLLCWMTKRKDGREDPPSLHAPNEKVRNWRFRVAWKVLESFRIDRAAASASEDLSELEDWVRQVRRQASDYGRTVIGDLYIGEVLGRTPMSEDSLTPTEEVCRILEVAPPETLEGFRLGVANTRGVTVRRTDEGGTQERTLAGEYQDAAKGLEATYPTVARVLLTIAKRFEGEAQWQDEDEMLYRRLDD